MLNESNAIRIARGSTFTLSLSLPREYDMTLAKEIWVTFVQHDKEVLTMTKKDLTLVGSTVRVVLSQDLTLKFSSGDCELQLRARLSNGKAIVQDPPAHVTFGKILKDGVI